VRTARAALPQVDLAGGVERLLQRTLELSSTNLPMACHLSDICEAAFPAREDVLKVRYAVYAARTAAAEGVMERGIFRDATRRAEVRLQQLTEGAKGMPGGQDVAPRARL
jgi:hypothetical protein